MTEQERKFLRDTPMWQYTLWAAGVIAAIVGPMLWVAITISISSGQFKQSLLDLGRRITVDESQAAKTADLESRNAAAIAGLTAALTIIESQSGGNRPLQSGGH